MGKKSQRVVPANTINDGLFFTEGDLVQQRLSRIGEKTLERKIKIAALLSTVVIIPASHILESPTTFSLISSTPRLLNAGVICPSLPEQFSTVSEYVRYKYRQSSKYSKYQLYTVAEFLDGNARSFVLRNDVAMRQYYKYRLIKDLANPNSLLSRSLKLSPGDVESLILEVWNIEPMSREASLALAEKLPRGQEQMFTKYLQGLYCITGSLGNNSAPMLHPSVLPFLEENIARIANKYNPNLFYSIAKRIGISEFILDNIPLSEAVDLHNDVAVKRFRKKYFELIEQARKGLLQTFGEPIEGETLQEVLLDLVDKKMSEEYKSLRTQQKVERIWTFLSFATSIMSSGIALLSGNPTFIGLAGASNLLNILDSVMNITDPLLSKMLDTQTEFVAFSSRLQRSTGAK